MEFFDINYVRQKHLEQYLLQDENAVPSDYLRKFTWFTVHHDRSAVRNRHLHGPVHLMWASHFPYDDSNWPDNRQQAVLVTSEVVADDRHAILAGNTAVFVFPLCIVLVFLVLAAQYESWSLPLAVILVVPMCLLSSIAGLVCDSHIFEITRKPIIDLLLFHRT